MKTKRNRIIVIFNILISILLIIPIKFIDLLNENYSTLSLNTRGYLYLLFLGTIIGLLLGYEMYYSYRKYYIYIAMGMILGVLVPHHVPYNLQGEMHLLFAYIGFFVVTIITFINVFIHNYQKILNIFILCILAAILLFIKKGMVNTLSEIIVIYSILFSNLYIFLKSN